MTEETFWVVWNVQHGLPRVKHDSLPAAIAEAKRLAAENPEQDFVVLQSVGTARCVNVEFVEHEPVVPF